MDVLAPELASEAAPHVVSGDDATFPLGVAGVPLVARTARRLTTAAPTQISRNERGRTAPDSEESKSSRLDRRKMRNQSDS